MIKMRLEGLPEDIDEYIDHLNGDDKVNVLEISNKYSNRGASKFVRVYVSIECQEAAGKNI